MREEKGKLRAEHKLTLYNLLSGGLCVTFLLTEIIVLQGVSLHLFATVLVTYKTNAISRHL